MPSCVVLCTKYTNKICLNQLLYNSTKQNKHIRINICVKLRILKAGCAFYTIKAPSSIDRARFDWFTLYYKCVSFFVHNLFGETCDILMLIDALSTFRLSYAQIIWASPRQIMSSGCPTK